jgi:general secretion pathway protein F
VARELRKRELTPSTWGWPKERSIEIRLPSFGGKKRRDVLFFPGAFHPAQRRRAGGYALNITGELTERPDFRFVVLDVVRVLKGGRSLADSLATHPEYFSDCTSA